MCSVNGRICPLDCGFTSVLHRHKAMVNYFLTTHEDLKQMSWFKVLCVNDLVKEFGAIGMCKKKVSDHNMIMCGIQMLNVALDPTQSETANTVNTEIAPQSNDSEDKYNKHPRKFKKKTFAR